MLVLHICPQIKVEIYFQNIIEFHMLDSLEKTHFKEAELFPLTTLACDFSRNAVFLYIPLSVPPDVCLDTGLFWTHAVPCLESCSPGLSLPSHTFDYSCSFFRSTERPSLTSPKSAPLAAPRTSHYCSVLFAASFPPGPGLRAGVQSLVIHTYALLP